MCRWTRAPGRTIVAAVAAVVGAVAALAGLTLQIVQRLESRPLCRVLGVHPLSGELIEVDVEFTNRHPSLPLRLVSVEVELPAGARLQTGRGVFREGLVRYGGRDLVAPGATHDKSHQIHRGGQGRQWHDGEPFALEIGYRLGGKRVRRLRVEEYASGRRRS